MQKDMRKATAAQIEQAIELINQDGSDPEWYDLEKMNRGQMQRFIDKAKLHLQEQSKIRHQILEAFDAVNIRKRG